MASVFSVVSTLLQGLIVLLGGFVTVAYSVSGLRRTIQKQNGVPNPKDLVLRMTFNLCLLGLYGAFAYLFAAEEMSDTGFRILTDMLGG